MDDNYWNRAAMASELDAHPLLAVVAVMDQDEAVACPTSTWDGVDVAVVDVFDETAPSEVGTDVFSGIAALDRLRALPVRTLAITPHCQHPLVQLRIHQAGADWLYHRWEVNDLDRLATAIIDPSPEHRPVRPSDDELRRHGAASARPNQAVEVYQRSMLHGRLLPEIGLKALRLPRRTTNYFRVDIERTGFSGTEELSMATTSRRTPRWPDVRDFMLAALGRRDVPPTEVDRDDLGGHLSS